MRAYRNYFSAFAGLLLTISTCVADGNRLLEQCITAERFLDTEEIRNQYSIGMCLGLVQGVRNTMQFMGNDGPIKACFPENGIDNGQATRIVTSYLKDNPTLLHENEVVLTMLAFIDAYPCN